MEDWFERITRPWDNDSRKISFEKENFNQIIAWESAWDWNNNVRSVEFKIQDGSKHKFTETF